jgi:hypothetical protein
MLTTKYELRLKQCRKCKHRYVSKKFGIKLDMCKKFEEACSWENHPLGRCFQAVYFEEKERKWWEFWK